jgi:uncharacterized membrane protein YhaH (DUF805 family)
MTFGEAIKSGFDNYANFGGRSQRSAFWWWYLFCGIVFFVIWLLDVKLLGDRSHVPSLLAQLRLVIPSMAVQVRRLHDTARSGWFILLNFVPLVGTFILLVWYSQRGTLGANQYGPAPLVSPAQ